MQVTDSLNFGYFRFKFKSMNEAVERLHFRFIAIDRPTEWATKRASVRRTYQRVYPQPSIHFILVHGKCSGSQNTDREGKRWNRVHSVGVCVCECARVFYLFSPRMCSYIAYIKCHSSAFTYHIKSTKQTTQKKKIHNYLLDMMTSVHKMCVWALGLREYERFTCALLTGWKHAFLLTLIFLSVAVPVAPTCVCTLRTQRIANGCVSKKEIGTRAY